jgi:hypothetical protein
VEHVDEKSAVESPTKNLDLITETKAEEVSAS